MDGTTLSYTAMMLQGEKPQPPPVVTERETDDHGAVVGPQVMSSVELAAKHGEYPGYVIVQSVLNNQQSK